MNRTHPVVRLRVPTDEDAYVWHRVFADPEVMRFHGGRAAELSVYEELTARQRRHDAELGFCLWSVLDGSGDVVGFTGAQPWPHAWGPAGEIEIGWRLGRAHWGLGYASAAAQDCLERVRSTGVRRVVAMVDSENERSIAVTQRLGMRLSERFTTPSSERQGLCYSLEL
ncbi:GNAT family N-acetyltransferase [Streptomyces sp. NPDC058459]|uniref:GNAT family N-acetyltransferase n=1 Tax=Streptomyces sp. NPDC058459 TaxID=3346508 RepID=UPI00364A85F8